MKCKLTIRASSIPCQQELFATVPKQFVVSNLFNCTSIRYDNEVVSRAIPTSTEPRVTICPKPLAVKLYNAMDATD